MTKQRDHEIDNLLALNGDRYFVDDKGELEAVFKVSHADKSPDRPHGISICLCCSIPKESGLLVLIMRMAWMRGLGQARSGQNNTTTSTLLTK
jgi:hypothetical protein